MNSVRMRLTLMRSFLNGNTDTVFATSWLDLKKGGS